MIVFRLLMTSYVFILTALAMFIPDASWNDLQRVTPTRVADCVRRAPHALAAALVKHGWALRRRPSVVATTKQHSGCTPALLGACFATLVKLFIIVHLIAIVLVGKVWPSAMDARTMSRMADVGRVLRLDQGWNVFSPRPPFFDWWVAFPGQLKGGYTVDVFR
jgi:hypothetical protein